MSNQIKVYTVPADLTELRALYAKYGIDALDGALRCISSALAAKIKKDMTLDTVAPVKLLVEG